MHFINRSLIVAIYLYDIIIAGKENKEIEEFKLCVYMKFKTNDLGELIYMMTCSRPYICYSINILSRFMEQHRALH